MKKLLSSEDSGIRMNGNDPIMELVMGMFTSLMALAVQIDGKEQERKWRLQPKRPWRNASTCRNSFPR